MLIEKDFLSCIEVGERRDFVIGVAFKADLEQVYKALIRRMLKCGLTLHTEKTKVLDFSVALSHRPTLDFLGFTYYLAYSDRGDCAYSGDSKEKF